jgi:hypothetical protein
MKGVCAAASGVVPDGSIEWVYCIERDYVPYGCVVRKGGVVWEHSVVSRLISWMERFCSSNVRESSYLVELNLRYVKQNKMEITCRHSSHMNA